MTYPPQPAQPLFQAPGQPPQPVQPYQQQPYYPQALGQPQQQLPSPPPPPPYEYVPAAGSPAEALLNQLDTAKAAAKAAADDADALVLQIEKAVAADILSVLPPGSNLPTVINIPGGPTREGRTMRWYGDKTTLDKDWLERDHPGLQDKYQKPVKAHWELRPMGR